MNETKTAQFSVADLLDRLTEEFGYSPSAAKQVATDLVQADPRVKQAFWRWWTTGTIDTLLNIEGYTVERLLDEKRAATPVAAFANLAFLASDPQTALQTLRWRERKPRFRSVPPASLVKSQLGANDDSIRHLVVPTLSLRIPQAP